VSYVLVLNDEEMEILGFAVNRTIREQRQQLSQILRERLNMLTKGETEVLAWKPEQQQNLIQRLYRLDAMSRTLDSAPNGTRRDTD